MRTKNAIVGFASSMQAIGLLGVAITLLSSSWADVEIRTYNESDNVAPGQTKSRLLSVGEPSPYYATSPFAISLTPQLEAPSQKWDVMPLRLNILVGSHRTVQGLDLGVLGGFSDYKMNGLGIAGIFNSIGESEGALNIAGIVNFVAFDYSGCQISGIYSCTEGKHVGIQLAIGNFAGRLTGAQIGVFNRAEKGAGLQLGVINSSDCLKGVQIGVLNLNKSSAIPLLPIVNFAF